jgi:DNA-binding GntR family transcriptional regulator
MRTSAPRDRVIVRPSLHEQVVEQLREMVIEHELAPGSRVDERLLCERLEVSRTPLREALKVLAAEGLIDLLPSRSARVAPITPESVAHRFDVMSWLERLAGERAVAHVTEKDVQRLQGLLKQMERLLGRGERLEYFRQNRLLHRGIVELAHNPVLSAVYDNLVLQIHRARYLVLDSIGHLDRGLKEHHEILEALAAKQGDRLGKLLMEHSRKTGQRIQQALAERAASASKAG